MAASLAVRGAFVPAVPHDDADGERLIDAMP
jgi:hypothetical protein